jgi:hypothetical protein
LLVPSHFKRSLPHLSELNNTRPTDTFKSFLSYFMVHVFCGLEEGF